MSSIDIETQLLTAEQLATASVDGPCELIEGRVHRMSPAGRRHGEVAGRIHRLLVLHDADGAVLSAETGYRLARDPDTVRAPDVAFVSEATLERSRQADEPYFPCAPDLAVEVLSPNDAWAEIERKVRDYLTAGGRAVWIVDPARETVTVCTPAGRTELSGRDEIDGGEAVPGFRAQARSFFA